MSDLSSVLTCDKPLFMELPGWREVLATFAAGAVPHSWAVRAPLSWHEPLLDAMSRLFLCDAGKGDDKCDGCLAWSQTEDGAPHHPDRIVVGEFDKAGNIEACRGLIRELSLRPVAARRRLGVVLAADKLLVHAANSLLKIAEEPPSHACLLFLLEGNDFLPTLRSRSRLTTFPAPLSFEVRTIPRGESEWWEWLAKSKEGEDVPGMLSGWTSRLLEAGEWERAARAEKLRLLVLQKKLSHSMACDLLILTLKEELPFEPIFGAFW